MTATRRLVTATGLLFAFLLPLPVAEPRSGCQALLDEVERFVWLNNWARAAELVRSESDPRALCDEKTEIYLRAADLRGNVESLALSDAAAQIESMLGLAPVQGDHELQFHLLSVKGDIDFQMDLATARETWETVRDLAAASGNSAWQARAEGELGAIAFLNGDVSESVRLVGGGLLKAEILGDVAAQIRYRTAIGEGLAELGRPAEAIRFFDRALKLAESTPGAYFPFTAYLGKARLQVARGHRDEGFRMLQAGLGEARSNGHRVRESRLLTVLGEVAVSTGDKERGVEWLAAAADTAEGAGLQRIHAGAATRLASLYRDSGDYRKAAEFAARSVEATRKAGDVYHLPQRMAVLAEILADSGKAAEADTLYSEAADAVDGLLSRVPGVKTRNTLVATMERVFRGHFDLRLNVLNDRDGAFQVLESARVRTLADLLRRTGTESGAGTPEIDGKLAAIHRRLATESDPGRRNGLLDDLWELEARAYPVSTANSSILLRQPPVSIAQVQSVLGPDETLVDFVLGDKASVAIAISSGEVWHCALPGRDAIEATVDRYVTEVRAKRDGRPEAQALHRMLLDPIELQHNRQRIVIVPDGKLHLLPFEALIDGTGRFAAETQVISYAPSATVLHLLRTARAPRPPSQLAFLGVGGVRYGSSAPLNFGPLNRGRGMFEASGPPGWRNLPNSLSEVKEIAALHDRRVVLTGAEATEDAVKSLPLARFRTLHFAVHTAVDRDFPERSALVLSGRDDDGEDGLLQAREIVGLNLNADLVTLAACDTDLGRIEGISGMNSLVQAFLVAGARSVVASLWDADDTFTATLMRRFYHYLGQGHDKAEALALAKREMLRMFGPKALPFYWAGFRLVGESYGTLSGGLTANGSAQSE